MLKQISINLFHIAAVSTLLCLLLLQRQAAAERPTEDVFRQYKSQVVQVRVIERSSGSKSGIGSGFFVSKDAHVVTNYHVISELVNTPQSYRLEVILHDGKVLPAQLLDLDIVHDLALIIIEREVESWFELSPAQINRGSRIYSIGNPRDLGFHIVEGTFNGNIENSLYEKINFTGSLNPGMSGGPAITEDGAVIGVNVSTHGNQLSFLVPAAYAEELLRRTLARGGPIPIRFSEQARMQLLENQKDYVQRLLAADHEKVDLGDYSVPSSVGDSFRCWAQVEEEVDQQPYKSLSHFCSTQDNIYVSRRLLTGAVTFRHEYIESKEMNMFQFYTLYQAKLEQHSWNLSAKEEDVTSFRCFDDFLSISDGRFKAALCARAYRKLTGLYDVVFISAALNDSHAGLLSSLVMTGISFENAIKFTKDFLGGVKWAK
ncbi:MAG: trypsin-like peptidase domain-containing protein [Bdellovibrionales bacterium]|nr:trypsin-like peptidase domain-containing protein [Bdellovibrionales bacterium]